MTTTKTTRTRKKAIVKELPVASGNASETKAAPEQSASAAAKPKSAGAKKKAQAVSTLVSRRVWPD